MAKPKSKPFRKPITYKKTLDEYTGPVTNNGGLGKRTVNNGIRGRGAYDKRSGQFRGVKWSSTPLAGSQTVQIGSGTAAKPKTVKAPVRTAAKPKTVKAPVRTAVKKTAVPPVKVTPLGRYIDGIILDVPQPIPSAVRTILPTDSVFEWYVRTWPDDDLALEIDHRLKFAQVKKAMGTSAIYKVIGVDDSIVRERIETGIREFYRDGVPINPALAPMTAKKTASKTVKAPVSTVKASVQPVAGLESWQMEVLTSPYIRLTTESKVKIYKTREENAEPINDIIARLRKVGSKKPIIMNPHEVFTGRYTDKQTVIKILMARPDYHPKPSAKTPVKQSPFNDPHISIVRPAITLQSGKDDGARILGLLKTTERYVMDLDDGPTQMLQAAKTGQIMINAGRTYASKRSPANKAAFAKALREFLIEIQKSDAFYEVPPTSDIKLAINGLRQEAGL